MPTALILGITGDIGSRLARRLLDGGWAVRGIGRDPDAAADLDDRGAQIEIADIGDPADLEGIGRPHDHVFYLIGSISGTNQWLTRVGLEGVRNAYHALAGVDVASFVYLDSLAVYGAGSDEVITELTPPEPNSTLGDVSLAAERLLRQAAATDGFPARIVRAGTIYGPGRGTLQSMRAGRLRLIGGGHNYSSRIHVEDLPAVLERAATLGRDGEIYLAVDDEPVSVATFFEHLGDRANVTPPKITLKLFARLLVTVFGVTARVTRGHSPLSHSLYSLVTASYRCSNAKARSELGVELRYPTYVEGVETLLEADDS